MRNLVAAGVVGVIVGCLAWLSFGDDFWRGFLAGLVVEEFMQLAPGMTEFMIVRSARWGAKDELDGKARQGKLRGSVDRYPGRIVKLIATAFVIIPSISDGVVHRVKPRLRLGKIRASATVVRTLRVVGTVLARALVILAVAGFVGGLAIVFWNSGEEAIRRTSDIADVVDISTVMSVGGVLVAAVGIASILMIIYGSLRYVMSGGESSSISAAKSTILYAIIGLVIAMATFSIIQVVASTLT